MQNRYTRFNHSLPLIIMIPLKNPIVNAVAAGVYIALLVTIMNHVSSVRPEDGLIMPILGLSLFTLSAAVMGYLFLSQPIQFYLDGKKKEAVAFFLRTVAAFAVITVIFLVVHVVGVMG